MNRGFQTNQRILPSGLAFRFVIVLLLCSAAIAQDTLEPNPNDGTITVNNIDWVENVGYFENTDSGLIYNWGTIDNRGLPLFAGIIDNFNLIENHNIINNQGEIVNNNQGEIVNFFGGAIDNRGTIDNDNIIDNQGTIDNWGTIYNYEFGTINNNAPGTIDNYGTIINDGTWNINSTFNNDGIFKGSGTFIGNLETLSGTLAPGSSAGTMTIQGDYTLGGTGTLEIEIWGICAGVIRPTGHYRDGLSAGRQYQLFVPGWL